MNLKLIFALGLICGCGVATLSTQQSSRHELLDLSIEGNYVSRVAHLATGKTSKKFSSQSKLPWPVPVLSIGNSNASYQNYSNDPYFHHGYDIRANAGDKVIASAGGKVVNIENYAPGNPAYWEVAILDSEGFLWQYHHVNKESIPEKIWEAFKTKAVIPQGEVIGEVYKWPVISYGERYDHIHLNVLGENQAYMNPQLFMVPLEDKSAPEIQDIKLYQNGKVLNSSSVSGAYTIALNTRDLINHKRFYVPPYEISYILNGDEEKTVWKFSTLPGGKDKKKFVHNFFIPKLTCGDYECRKIWIDLGFSQEGNLKFTEDKGEHNITVIAKDYEGGHAQKNFTWTVK